MGITLLMLSLIVLIPLSTILLKTSGMGFQKFLTTVLSQRAIAAYKVSFLCSFLAACINVVFGLLIAWVLVKYDFPFKKIVDGIIDLPFALPTAVAGIALTTLYAENGWLGSILHKLGIKVAYSLVGITIALVFMGIPFVVRAVQPVLQGLDYQEEDAACILGASRWTIFRKIIFPELRSPLMNGFAIALPEDLGKTWISCFYFWQYANENRDCSLVNYDKARAI